MDLHYREDILEKICEKDLDYLENMYHAGPGEAHVCYVRHHTNGKSVVCGPFKEFIRGYLVGREERESDAGDGCGRSEEVLYKPVE